ncbi:oxidoreductase [Mesorhizobium caraganae]|uniref:PDR/VanB family oxidoreductase n=1 Tax=Mesorhizobium caraganae TaxID=483206 RepID=UPI0017827357|nr:PDR/VanB family oxidoreductase [Mesorhizobium caraganae]MBM2712937.1 oxidoreductase [Mesorhizobium caraganae]
MASPRLIMKMKVASLRHEAGDVSVVEFRHPRRPQLPSFEAGSHVDIHMPGGKVRQYSLMGHPADLSRYLIGVKREETGRGGSAWLHANLKVGDEMPVSAPRNHFRLHDKAQAHLLLGGGIGITPMIAMARALEAQGKAFVLHFFARSRSMAPMLADLEAELPADRLVLHFDDDPATVVDLAELLKEQKDGTHLYYCGPPGFMAWARASSAHWKPDTVHFEAFQPEEDPNFAPEPFTIQLHSTGQELEVPANASALTVLRAAGLLLFSSCENGVCGSCECGFVAGEPIHRDAFLSPEARTRRFIPCVSRAKGQIILDL